MSEHHSNQAPHEADARRDPEAARYRTQNAIWEQEYAVKVLDKSEWRHAACAFLVFALIVILSSAH